jgi:hypothetical protein
MEFIEVPCVQDAAEVSDCKWVCICQETLCLIFGT